jgi:hypothetical protein
VSKIDGKIFENSSTYNNEKAYGLQNSGGKRWFIGIRPIGFIVCGGVSIHFRYLKIFDS